MKKTIPVIDVIMELSLHTLCLSCDHERKLKWDGQHYLYMVRCPKCGTYPATTYQLRNALMNVAIYREKLKQIFDNPDLQEIGSTEAPDAAKTRRPSAVMPARAKITRESNART